jgi:hypothetical protein
MSRDDYEAEQGSRGGKDEETGIKKGCIIKKDFVSHFCIGIRFNVYQGRMEIIIN